MMNGFQKQKQSQTKLIILANGYNIPEKNKNLISLPKLQDSNYLKRNGNPRSLSPFEHRRIKTSQDNILKTSLQIFPSNSSNSNNKSQLVQQAIEEYPAKRVKQPMKSAQLNRNLYSGSKHRKSSEYNPKIQRTMNLSSGNRGSISTPNMAASQQKLISSTQILQLQYIQQQQQLQLTQSPSSYSLPQINLRPPSKSTGSASSSSQKSQKNINFSVSAAQYYSAEIDNLIESHQSQQIQFSQISNPNISTPEMNKKFSIKTTMAGKLLQPIFEEMPNNQIESVITKQFQGQEQQTQTNQNLSPSVSKINIPLSTQNKLQQQKEQQINQVGAYFFSNQNRQYLVRKGQKTKPKTIAEGTVAVSRDKIDEQLERNYKNLIREKDMQQESYNKSIQRYLQDIKQLREEKDALAQKLSNLQVKSHSQELDTDLTQIDKDTSQVDTDQAIKDSSQVYRDSSQDDKVSFQAEKEQLRAEKYQLEIEKDQFKAEKEQLCSYIAKVQNLKHNELLMQLDLLCDRLQKQVAITQLDNHYQDILNQFSSVKRHIQTIHENLSNQNNSKSNLTINPFICFYPPHLIKFDHSQRLGKGGFCAVYKVQVGDQEMAQKVFEYDMDECSSIIGETLEGIFNEVKILLKVNTFNNQTFVKLHGISFDIRRNEMSGRDQFVFAIFMELIGTYDKNRFLTCDLKKFIVSQRNKLNYNKKYLELGLQIAEGIETLYNNNIVHSDLKPQNILLDDNYNIKFIDFGTSKFNTQAFTHDTNLLGFTPRYCPLEHFDMEKLTPTTDIWSFGCLLFEMITGNEPWRGIKNLQDVRKALENRQSLWQHYQSQTSKQETNHINPEVIKLIEKCTSYENRPHPSYVTEKINEILLQQN